MENQYTCELAQNNAPFYAYDKNIINNQINLLKDTFTGFDILYSIKANPFEGVVKIIADNKIGGDASSTKEVSLALKCGMDCDNIYYSACGKDFEDIEFAVDKCTIIADSISEVVLINKIAERKNKRLKIGIRINPDFTVYSDHKGVSSKFGIDVEQLSMLAKELINLPFVEIAGIHVHIKSQLLDYKLLANYYKNCFELAKKVVDIIHCKIEFVNFGGGVGIVYNANKELPVNLAKLKESLIPVIEDNNNTLKAKLIVESGRFLVCNAGTYYTIVVDIKVSRGKKYLIVKNGLNGFMRPFIAQLLKSNASGNGILPHEPLFTGENCFEFKIINDAKEKEVVDIVGNLCTCSDIVAEAVELNVAQIGDILAITNAGSYAYSLSPLTFSGHKAPQQFVIENGLS